MSYILDALQESQKNRDDKNIPDLNSAHGGSNSARRVVSRWIYMGAVAVLMVSGLAIWWIIGWQGGAERPSIAQRTATEQTALETSAVEAAKVEKSSRVDERDDVELAQPGAARNNTPTRVSETDHPAVQANSPPSPLSATHSPDTVELVEKARVVINKNNPDPSSNIPIMDTVMPTESPQSKSGQSIDSRRVVEDTRPVEIQSPPSVAPDVSSPAVIPVVKPPATPITRPVATPIIAIDTQEAVAAQTLVKIGQESVSTEGSQGAESAARALPHFRELPFDVQKSLPAIVYSVHLYAAEPKHRMVKIDGRVRREGDMVKPGLILEEITMTGAVFSFKDNVFRIPVNG